jgi:transcription elongation factor GreA
MVPEFMLQLEEKVRKLEYELKNELPKEIGRARELGDLSENAEYHAAKERQDLVGAQLAKYKQRLADLRMVDFTKIRDDAVGLGSTVRVIDVDTDAEIQYELVASEEADVPNGKISTTSPIGRSFMNKVAGDAVEVQTPGGRKDFEIISFTTIHDKV